MVTQVGTNYTRRPTQKNCLALRLETVRIKDIDVTDTRFLHRYCLYDNYLQQSIKAHGILSPPVLVRERQRYSIVAGFKRIRCVQALKQKTVAALIVVAQHPRVPELFMVALQSNSAATLTDIDRAIALRKAKELFAHNWQVLEQEVAPSINVAPSRCVIGDYIRVAGIVEPLQAMMARGELSFKGALAISQFSFAEQLLIWRHLLRHCFFSASEIKIVCELLRSILKRTSVSLASFVHRPKIRTIVHTSHVSRRDRGLLLIEYLRTIQNPRLTALRNMVAKEVKKLSLTKNTKVTVPPAFEEDYYTVAIQFAGEKELRMALASLERNAAALARLCALDNELVAGLHRRGRK